MNTGERFLLSAQAVVLYQRHKGQMQVGRFLVHVYHRRHDIFPAYPPDQKLCRPLGKRLYLLWGFSLEKHRAGGDERIDKPGAVLSGAAPRLFNTALNEVVIASRPLDDMEVVFTPAGVNVGIAGVLFFLSFVMGFQRPCRAVSYTHLDVYKRQIQELAEGFMKEPKLITLAEETTVNAAITHYAYEVKEKQKLSFLKQLLCKEQPASCIIFARTQEGVKTICDELYALDMCVDKLHGGMLQEDRIENIRDFKRGKIRILVATDVAARGIDVQDISHIINYDMPNQKETYLHRIGRTGRQRASGKAITLINEYDGERKAELEDYLGYPLEIRERGEISNQDVTKETIEPLTKPFALREDKGKEVHKDTMKLYLNGGKTKKIRAGDIVGAICEIQGVSAEDIGVIQIQDNQSYVDILNGKGKQVLKTLQQSTIKGKKLKVQKAKEQGE